MSSDESSGSDAREKWCCRSLAVLLIMMAAVLHLLYLAWNCPLDLAPDEAHYWDWSRHLDWSYYSKGPLVAYLIRASVGLAGPWSRHLIGSDMLAVRLPAVLCGSLLLASLYVLSVQVYRRERLALAVVALALTLPAISAGSTLMTIDAPYTCCWGWALVLGYQACFRRSSWAWPAAGLVVGAGILAKYTMVLWLPSLGLFLLTSPECRRQIFRPNFWIMVGVAFLCCTPILIWNAQNGWVTFRHVGGQAGLRNRVHWLGPLVYFGTQCALLMGYWFVAWLAAMIASRPWKELDRGARYLWWMSAPMFVSFFLFGFKTGGGEPNWPVTAYLSGLVLAVAWLTSQLQSPVRWYRRATVSGLACACALGLSLIALMHFGTRAQPILGSLSGPATVERPYPLRRFDPTCRLRGWRYLASEVDRVREELDAEGVAPILACSAWSLPGELGFYCAGHPVVYSLGLAMGDRWSQYDLWRPNPVQDVEDFAGRTVLFVGILSPRLAEAFEHVDPPRRVTYEEGGQPIAGWSVVVCRGFRGFQSLKSAAPRF